MKLICQLLPRRVTICWSLMAALCAASAWSFASHAEIGRAALGEFQRFAFTGQFRFQMHRPNKTTHYKRVRPALVVASRYLAAPGAKDRIYGYEKSRPVTAPRVAHSGNKLTFLRASSPAQASSNPAINISSARASSRVTPTQPGRPIVPLPSPYLLAKKKVTKVIGSRRPEVGKFLSARSSLGVGTPQKPVRRKGKAVAALTAPRPSEPTDLIPALPPLPQVLRNRSKVETKKTIRRAKRRPRNASSKSRRTTTSQTPSATSGSSWVSNSPKWASSAFRGD